MPEQLRSELESVDRLVSDLLNRIDAVAPAPGGLQKRGSADIDAFVAEFLATDSAGQPVSQAVPVPEVPQPAQVLDSSDIDAEVERTLQELDHVQTPSPAAPSSAPPAVDTAPSPALPEAVPLPLAEFPAAGQTAAKSAQAAEFAGEKPLAAPPEQAPTVSRTHGARAGDGEPQPRRTMTLVVQGRRPVFLTLFILAAIVLIGLAIRSCVMARSSGAAAIRVPVLPMAHATRARVSGRITHSHGVANPPPCATPADRPAAAIRARLDA